MLVVAWLLVLVADEGVATDGGAAAIDEVEAGAAGVAGCGCCCVAADTDVWLADKTTAGLCGGGG